MILLGLGSNLTGGVYDSQQAVLMAALAQMADRGIHVEKLSPFYETEPVPKSDQPWFVNAVAAVTTDLAPRSLLKALHDIEENLGRSRRIRWEARIIDLDILAYDDKILPSEDAWSEKAEALLPDDIIIPHPRLHERLFVLKPLSDLAPMWRHPVFGDTVDCYIATIEAQGSPGAVRKIDAPNPEKR
ncbi:2-amino-4-hydroxy-6-hydroxymethyldihydropteridine diphosphokinase [Paremcibacter congregatus]|uniref:2-amino-4-hydroxy-6- hydroxymethyldihydropteridine diphosphokinase n=1 Tax=Paremcibacter congregatus TaxID=2043170 RepID=UPI0030EED5AD|tara:strand:- start:3496 stop:4056 length:561 start_codon:yes stop_codon:yes gene_type:complete